MKTLQKIEGAVLASIMILTTAGYAGMVLIRVFAPSVAPNFGWIEEVSLLGIIWMVFLGLGLALQQARHIAMHSVLKKLSTSVQYTFRILINAIGLIFSLFLTKIGWDISVFVLESGQTSGVMSFSMVWLYAVMPIGFALLSLQYLSELTGLTNRHAIELDPAQGH